MKSLIGPLETRMSNLELGQNVPVTAKFDLTDVAHRQIEFRGFPLQDVAARLEAMSAYLARFPNFAPKFFNQYEGPYGKNRSLSSKEVAEFANQDQKREFMEVAASQSMTKFGFQGHTVEVKHAVSKINKRRTYLLYKAEA